MKAIVGLTGGIQRQVTDIITVLSSQLLHLDAAIHLTP